MTTHNRQIKQQRRVQATELLKKGLTTRQIAERTGMTTRTVLRIKKQELEMARGPEEAAP